MLSHRQLSMFAPGTFDFEENWMIWLFACILSQYLHRLYIYLHRTVFIQVPVWSGQLRANSLKLYNPASVKRCQVDCIKVLHRLLGSQICFRDSAASKKGCLGLGCTSLCREAPGLQEALEAPQRKRHGPVCAPAPHSQLGLGCDWFRENLYIFPGGWNYL